MKIEIHNNKCKVCGKEVKNITKMLEHYKCFSNDTIKTSKENEK